MDNHPLTVFIGVAVPLYIMQLERQDGPTDYQVEQARKRGIANADYMMFHGGEEAKGLADDLAEVIAILAFAPGGIDVFDYHFEGKLCQEPSIT